MLWLLYLCIIATLCSSTLFIAALSFPYPPVEIKVGTISLLSLPLNPFLPFGYFFRTPAPFTLNSDFHSATWHIFKLKVPYVKTVLPWERRVKNKTRLCRHINCLLLYICVSTFRQVLVCHKTARALHFLTFLNPPPPRHYFGAFTKFVKLYRLLKYSKSKFSQNTNNLLSIKVAICHIHWQ